MFKQIILLILFFFALSIKANAIPRQIVLSYGLVSSYENENEIYKEKVPRVPALQQTVTLDDNLLTFSAFGNDFTIYILEVDTEELVFHATVPAGVTFCSLDSSLHGTYIIQFIFGPYMYWGYITL